ncbi:hypothetical protein LPTSP2_39000 [Leptospira ellinghausenii]|uniref:SH3b domain-containing protein n=1 Tax=Leptospira ellinghausenii TaxID=1917822 RepID=A0A2P2DIW0_9LEPT|nr:hypothetical protein LPTSP2_39000 [Leptospira ellinghausenii]
MITQNFKQDNYVKVNPGKFHYVSAISGLNIRKQPDKNSEKYTKLNSGKIIKVDSTTNKVENIDNTVGEWVKIRFDNNFYYAFSPYLKESSSLVEDLYNLNSKDLFQFINSKLKQRRQPTEIDWDDFKNKPIFLNKILQFENYILISISPTEENCSKYKYSDCMNFILKNEKLIFTDLDIGISTGDPYQLSNNYVQLSYYGGEGGDCNFYSFFGTINTFSINLKNFDVIEEYTEQTNKCKNKCPCNPSEEIKKVERSYKIIKSNKNYTDREMKKIFDSI